MREQEDTLKYWWITEENVESESGLIEQAVWYQYKDFRKLKRVAWKWFRARAGRKDLTPASKLVLWALVERHRYNCMGVRDSLSYISKMTGLNRHTVSRCVHELASEEKNIIWIAAESEKLLMRKIKKGYKTYILFVGLNRALKDSERGLGENTFLESDD